MELNANLRRQLLTDIQGEHRLVTVVFADLTSSVKRTQHLHVEEATRLVNSLLEAMVEILIRFGGRIDRFLGDGVLAVFGIPETHEDDPERAVRAALGIQERASELGLGVTVGINTGRVYFGPVGSSLHEELTVMGPVVNLAARLQGKAQKGQVLIGESTRSHIYSSFQLTPLPLQVKGIDHTVTAYRVERLLPLPTKVRGIEGMHSQFVGRQKELNHLLKASRQGAGRLVVLVGNAGLGKSRVAAEFKSHFVAQGGNWLEGWCRELTRERGYGPIRDLLQREFSSKSPLRQALHSSLESFTSSGKLPNEWLEELAPFLVRVATGEDGDPRFTQATPVQRKALTATAIGDFLEAAVGETRTVLFIDDLHWVDELTADLLVSLMARLSNSPITFLGSYRPDQGTWADQLVLNARKDPRLRVDTLILTELEPTESRTLLCSLLGTDALPKAIERRLIDRAEGNPFYLEELVRSLIQNDMVSLQDGIWSFTTATADLEVPDSVHALLISRLNRLERDTQRCAQLLSVLGRTFSRQLIESVADRNVETDLDSLMQAGILTAHPKKPGHYSFVHALTQQGIYETLLPSRRAELHQRAGYQIEQLSPDEVEALAFHFERSLDNEKAIEYLLAAGESAMNAFLTETALDYIDRGLSRLREVTVANQEVIVLKFHAHRGEILERMARHEEARRDLQTALEGLSLDPLESARLARLVGQTFRLQGNFEKSFETYALAEQVLNSAPESALKHQTWIEVQKEKSFALYWGGREQELPEHNARIAEIVEQHGTVSQRIDHQLSCLLSAFRAHRFRIPPDVVSIGKRTAKMASETADSGRIAEVQFALGFALLWADALDEADRTLRVALRGAERIGDVMLQNRALAYLATCLRRLGRPDRTEDFAERALKLAQSLDDNNYAGLALANLCWVEWKRGKFKKASRFGRKALRSWGEKKGPQGEGIGTEFAFLAVLPLSSIEVDEGNLEKARQHLLALCSPWERASSPKLDRAIGSAAGKDSRVEDFSRLFHLAQQEHLL